MIFSFSRMRKIPQRMKKVSCLTRASFNNKRLPSLTEQEYRVAIRIHLWGETFFNTDYYELFRRKKKKKKPDLTALVTSANCMRSYFLSSWFVGMWPWKYRMPTGHVLGIISKAILHIQEFIRHFLLATSWQVAGRWEWVVCSSGRSGGCAGMRRTGTLPLSRHTNTTEQKFIVCRGHKS